MELIVFLLAVVNGSLIIATGYFTYTAARVERNNNRLNEELDRTKAHVSILRADLEEEVKELRTGMLDISSNMEKDSYKNLSEINKKLVNLENITKDNVKGLKLCDNQHKQTLEKFSNVDSRLKRFGDDPNLLRRY